VYARSRHDTARKTRRTRGIQRWMASGTAPGSARRLCCFISVHQITTSTQRHDDPRSTAALQHLDSDTAVKPEPRSDCPLPLSTSTTRTYCTARHSGCSLVHLHHEIITGCRSDGEPGLFHAHAAFTDRCNRFGRACEQCLPTLCRPSGKPAGKVRHQEVWQLRCSGQQQRCGSAAGDKERSHSRRG